MVEQEKRKMVLENRRICSSNKREAPLFSWPWENLDNLKYLLYGPLIAKVLYAISKEEIRKETWCLHILILFGLRALVHQLWSTYSNLLFLNRTRQVNQQGVEFKQIDAEWHWDNFLILQAIVATFFYLSFPSLAYLPIWNTRGILCCLILHMGISEPLFYWIHRILHSSTLFQQYHWLHHSSKVTHPFTAGHATFLEHLLLCIVVGIPTLTTAFMGYGSISMMYGYILLFDFLRCLGHCNVEIIHHSLFENAPLLKYLIYTPTYHSLHHKEMGSNFCLFMPLYDKLWNTMNPKYLDLHKEICSRTRESLFFLNVRPVSLGFPAILWSHALLIWDINATSTESMDNQENPWPKLATSITLGRGTAEGTIQLVETRVNIMISNRWVSVFVGPIAKNTK